VGVLGRGVCQPVVGEVAVAGDGGLVGCEPSGEYQQQFLDGSGQCHVRGSRDAGPLDAVWGCG